MALSGWRARTFQASLDLFLVHQNAGEMYTTNSRAKSLQQKLRTLVSLAASVWKARGETCKIPIQTE
jgi:hypothetical protein